MKAKMIRQGVITPNFLTKTENAAGQEGQAATAALQKRMTMTGMKFNAAANKGPADFASTKGFADVFIGDPSLKKLKEDIGLKETQNQ